MIIINGLRANIKALKEGYRIAIYRGSYNKMKVYEPIRSFFKTSYLGNFEFIVIDKGKVRMTTYDETTELMKHFYK